MSSETAFNPSTDVSFVVKNTSSLKRAIKVFNTLVGFGNQIDAMKIPGVTEEDLVVALTKGDLKNLIAGGSLTVVSSTVNFATSDGAHNEFLKKEGITSGLIQNNIFNINS